MESGEAPRLIEVLSRRASACRAFGSKCWDKCGAGVHACAGLLAPLGKFAGLEARCRSGDLPYAGPSRSIAEKT